MQGVSMLLSRRGVRLTSFRSDDSDLNADPDNSGYERLYISPGVEVTVSKSSKHLRECEGASSNASERLPARRTAARHGNLELSILNLQNCRKVYR
jgi:hypothetical protein